MLGKDSPDIVGTVSSFFVSIWNYIKTFFADFGSEDMIAVVVVIAIVGILASSLSTASGGGATIKNIGILSLLLFGVYKIKLALEKESALNNQQKNFFLSVTHELKTPIAATKLQLQTLLKQKLNESTQHDLINTALKETERLNSLIDNVLIASRMDANEFDFKLKKQNLSQIINQVINRYYKKEIELGEITVCIQDNLSASIDEFSFPSIITNLVDNAIKYSLDPKNIYIDLIGGKEFITFKISDNGCGISDKDKVNVFTKFFRGENENIRNSKGTGLGLYIVKQIVKGHKGEIVVKNNLPKGITFEIKLNEA